MNDDFELEVRQAFKAHGAALDPLVIAADQARPARLVEHASYPIRTHVRASASLAVAGAVALIAILVATSGFGQPKPLGSISPAPSGTTAAANAWPKPVISTADLSIGNVAGGARGWVAVVSRDRQVRQLWYSADGSAWARSNQAEQDLARAVPRGLVALPDGFLMFGSETTVNQVATEAMWRSSDGQHWTKLAIDPRLIEVWDVLRSGGAYVAIAKSGVWLSMDLEHWNGPLAPAATAAWHAGAGSGTGFVIATFGTNVTSAPFAMWSVDGKTWSDATLPYAAGDSHIGTVAAARDGILITAYAGALNYEQAWASIHGLTWTVAREAAEYGVGSVASDGTYMYASAKDGLIRSTDGMHWQQVRLLPSEFEPSGAFEILAASPSGVAVTDGERLWLLTHPGLDATGPVPDVSARPGTTSQPSPPPDAWQSVASDTPLGSMGMGPGLVTVGAKGVVARWSRPAGEPCGSSMVYSHGDLPFRPADTSDPSFRCAVVEAVVATPTGFVARGLRDADDSARRRTTIWTSADGSIWKPVSTMAFASATIADMTYDGSELVAVGSIANNGMVWTSRDGSAWQTMYAIPGGYTVNSVGGNARFGLLDGGSTPRPGGGSSPAAGIWSAGMSSWTAVTLPASETDLTEAAVTGVYVARDGILLCGEGRTGVDSPAIKFGWQSVDGSAWTFSTACDATLFADGMRIVRSDGSGLEQSFDGATWTSVETSDLVSFRLLAIGPDGVVVQQGDMIVLLKLKGRDESR